MPRSDSPKYIERTLDSRTVAQYSAQTKWLTLLIYEGPRLNFAPESVKRLRGFLREFLGEGTEEAQSDKEETPTIHGVLSELHQAELNDGWLTLVAANRHYDLTLHGTQRLKKFLNEVVVESQEGLTDAH